MPESIDWGSLVNSGIYVGGSLAAGAERQAKIDAAQEKQINARFEQMAQQVARLFQTIAQRLPAITANDLAVAQQAFQTVAGYVSQNPTDYIVQQWNSAAYRQAGESDLAKFQSALTALNEGTPNMITAIESSRLGTSVPAPSSAIGGWAIAALIALALLIASRKG